MDEKTIIEKIKESLEKHTGCDPSTIAEATTFVSLGADSLDAVEMIMELEDEVGVALDFDAKITTVGALATYIKSKME